MPSEANAGSWSWPAFTTGLAVSMVLLAVLEAGAVVALAKRDGERARKGWNLVDVLVATRDLPEGAVLGPGDVAVGKVPEQFATDSVLRPPLLGALNGLTLGAPVQHGDALTRGLFEVPPLAVTCHAQVTQTAERLGLQADADVTAFLSSLKGELERGDRARAKALPWPKRAGTPAAGGAP